MPAGLPRVYSPHFPFQTCEVVKGYIGQCPISASLVPNLICIQMFQIKVTNQTIFVEIIQTERSCILLPNGLLCVCVFLSQPKLLRLYP